MTTNKYTAALLQFVLILVTAFQAAISNGLTTTEAWQLVALGIAAVGTYFLPLVTGPWAGALKVGIAVLGAVVAAIIPLVLGQWTAETFIIVMLAGLNALAAQIGVSARMDSVTAMLVDPDKSSGAIFAVDPPASRIVSAVLSE